MKKIKRNAPKAAVVKKGFDATQFFYSRGSKIVWIISACAAAAVCVSLIYLLFYRREIQASYLLSQAEADIDYEKIIYGYTFTKVKPIAIYSLARELFSQDRYDEAENLFRIFIEKYPKHRLAPTAYIGLAYCNEEKGNFEEAKDVFKHVKDKFPGIVWAEEAKEGYNRIIPESEENS